MKKGSTRSIPLNGYEFSRSRICESKNIKKNENILQQKHKTAHGKYFEQILQHF